LIDPRSWAPRYDEYALRAFDAGALDYLLKPFDDSRFQLAMMRAKEQIVQRRLQAQTPPLVIRSAGQVAYVQIAAIDWVEAADYYACVHVGAKSHLLRRSIAELEKELDPRLFCRIHRTKATGRRVFVKTRPGMRRRPAVCSVP
jgi:two-component system, LytTR family, response regulator